MVFVTKMLKMKTSGLKIGMSHPYATASGATIVFIVGLILAVINFILSLFMKKPGSIVIKD